MTTAGLASAWKPAERKEGADKVARKTRLVPKPVQPVPANSLHRTATLP